MIDEVLSDLSDTLKSQEEDFFKQIDSFWNSLSEDNKLKAFCSVVKRIYEGEIEGDRSYRGVLYDVFNFGPEAYAPAQYCGYLEIHNSILNRPAKIFYLEKIKENLINLNIEEEKASLILENIKKIFDQY